MGAKHNGAEYPDFFIKFYIHYQYYLHYPPNEYKKWGKSTRPNETNTSGRHNVYGYITYINPLTVARVGVIQSFNDTLGQQ